MQECEDLPWWERETRLFALHILHAECGNAKRKKRKKHGN
jgi:hypothetical protein